MEGGDCGDDRALLSLGELGIDGKGENLVAGRFGCGEVAGLVTEIGKGFLKVQGDRIVDFRRNTAGEEVLTKIVAIGGADGELIVDMNGVRRDKGQRYFRFQLEFAEEIAITIGIALAGNRPFIQILQFDAENGSLKGVEAAIDTQQLVDVFVAGAVHMQEAEPIGQGSIVGSHDARIACGAEILGGEKAETAHQSEAANRAFGIARANGLGSVFDDGNAVRRSELKNRIHIGRQAKKMDGHDGAGTRSDYTLDGLGRDVEGLRIDIDKDRSGSYTSNGAQQKRRT